VNDHELERAVSRLPKTIEPPHDLWPGVEARLRRRQPKTERSSPLRWPPM